MGLQLQLVAATIEANTGVSTNASVDYSIELALAWRGPLQPSNRLRRWLMMLIECHVYGSACVVLMLVESVNGWEYDNDDDDCSAAMEPVRRLT